MVRSGWKFLVGGLALCGSTMAQAECFTSLEQVKANHVKTRWQETTANDGKPMSISIVDSANGMIFSAKKAGATWLTGNVSVCAASGSTDITLKNTQTTSNVPMLLKMGMPSTLSAPIVNNQIVLSGGGWSGTFQGL